MASELFGHKKGSFTGAESDRKGAFLSAHQGTLFLDEVGDLSLSIQAKLLRALENQKIKPVGGDTETPVNVRIIAATHKSLSKMVGDGDFRMDLYYRLNVIQVNIPSLNERAEDIPILITKFSNEHNIVISEKAAQIIAARQWNGNIRELKNFIMKLACVYPQQCVSAEQAAKALFDVEEYIPEMTHSRLTRNILKQIERGLLLQRLVENDWNQRKTAKDLGMPKSTLNDQIKRYGISKPSDL